MKAGKLPADLAKALGNPPSAQPAPESPADEADRKKGGCAAYGCRLAGSMAEHSGSTRWWCAFHYGRPTDELKRITEVLVEHAVLLDVVVESRDFYADPQSHWETIPARAQSVSRRLADAGVLNVPKTNDLRVLGDWAEAYVGGQVRDVIRLRQLARR